MSADWGWGAAASQPGDGVVDGELLDEMTSASSPSEGDEAPEFDPMMMVADVARLSGDVASLADLVSDPDRGLLKQVADHAEALEALLDMLGGQPGGPWHWSRIDADRKRKLWLELGEWVAWLESRYLVNLPSADFELAACWWKHPVAVELLTALMVAHSATYSTKATVPSFVLVEWHTRALEPVFAALKAMKVFTNCANGHQAPTRSTRHVEQDFLAWVDEVAPDPIDIDEEGAA